MLDAQRKALIAHLRECFGRVVYTHKTHEKMADGCSTKQRRLKWAQIAIAAATASGASLSVFLDGGAVKAITAVAAIASLVLNGYAKDIDPGASAQKHREAAADIWNLRESYLNLLTDAAAPEIPLEVLRSRRDQLQASLHAVYRRAPHTDDVAYAKAQRSLKVNEDMTFSDEEIDHFLPSPLRQRSGPSGDA
jgi:hypothetical protein